MDRSRVSLEVYESHRMSLRKNMLKPVTDSFFYLYGISNT